MVRSYIFKLIPAEGNCVRVGNGLILPQSKLYRLRLRENKKAAEIMKKIPAAFFIQSAF